MATEPSMPVRKRSKNRPDIWRTRWYDDAGKQQDKTFGYCDDVSERQMRARFTAWYQTWKLNRQIRNPGTAAVAGVSALADAYLAWAKTAFVKHGRMTSTVWNVAYAMQDLVDHFGKRDTHDVTGPDIAGLRESMIIGFDDGKPYTRSVKTVNDRLYIVKQAFLWGHERGLVPENHLFGITQVKPLKAGRTAATAPTKVQPIDEHWACVAKDHCSRQVGAMIDLQWLTAMRPGSAVIMRMADIERGKDVWLYTPHEHKLEHKGKLLIIPLGPQAQAIIEPFIDRPPTAYLFSPAEAEAERRELLRTKRKTPLYAAHVRRYDRQRTDEPERSAGERYSEESYRRAIHRACERAQREARKLDPEAVVPVWNPNQLRHSAATRLNKLFGLEDVSVLLGHSDVKTTRIYAQPDVSKAVDIARKVG
ncbi:MAG: tyrosine-type recombinase/integrase [Anaerolineae bacterium]|nr:tyrosine-type recombinase/integrase [Phycisphaerae bacterium]